MHNAPVTATPIDSVLVRYYENHASKTASAEANRFALAKWSDFWVHKTIDELTLVNQEAFIAWLADAGASAGYIRRIFNIGKAAFNWAYRRQEIQQPPFIMTPRRGGERDRVLTPAESSALITAAADTDHLFRFVILMFTTLARPSAILDLTRFQVDRKNRRIDLNPAGREQTKKHRPVVPITETLSGFLDQWDGDYLVHWHGRQVRSVKTAFRKARDRAGLDGRISAYTIRHTMATELRRAGVPQWEVQGWLGHKTGSSTDVYAKFAPDYLAAGAREIDRYMSQVMTNTQLTRTECTALPKSTT